MVNKDAPSSSTEGRGGKNSVQQLQSLSSGFVATETMALPPSSFISVFQMLVRIVTEVVGC